MHRKSLKTNPVPKKHIPATKKAIDYEDSEFAGLKLDMVLDKLASDEDNLPEDDGEGKSDSGASIGDIKEMTMERAKTLLPGTFKNKLGVKKTISKEDSADSKKENSPLKVPN